MGWAKFDDRFPSNRKVRPLSDAGFRLDVSAICWCSEQLTDGRIARDELAQVSDVRQPGKAATELVRRGRWHLAGQGCGTDACPTGEGDDGWQIHDYLVYNPTKATVLARRDADNRRKRAPGPSGTPPPTPNALQPDSDRKGTGIRKDSERNPAGVRADASRALPRPDPARPEGTAGEGGETPLPKADAREHEPGGNAPPDPDADPLTRLVAEVQAIRPTWSDQAIRTAARRCTDHGRSPADTRHALLDVAGRTDTTAPGRATADGPWWPGPTTPSPRPFAEQPELRLPPADPERTRRGLALVRQALADPTAAVEEAS